MNGTPTAAKATFPYIGHRTMAQVIRQERQIDLVAQGWEDEENEERDHKRAMRRGSTLLLRAMVKATAR